MSRHTIPELQSADAPPAILEYVKCDGDDQLQLEEGESGDRDGVGNRDRG